MARIIDEAPVPLPTLEAHLTAEFYRWEVRGRGWQVWDGPVLPEPPFRPFLGHTLPHLVAPIDDARKPTRLGSLLERFRRSLTGASDPASSGVAVFDDEELLPEEDDSPDNLVELVISLPPDQRVTPERAEQFLVALSALRYPVAFEVIGRTGTITVRLVARTSDAGELRRMVQAYFPEAAVSEASQGLHELWQTDEARESVVVDFGLSREFMLPLQMPGSFEVDPLIAVVGALTDLRDGELGVFQVLLQSTRHAWAPSILRAVTDGEGDSFFADAPEIVTLAREKVARPLFAAVVRAAARGHDPERAWDIARALGGSLAQFTSPVGNELIPLTNDDYPGALHEEDLLRRKSHRNGMLLSSGELAALVHLPSASVRSESLAREAKHTKASPAVAVGHVLVLGENTHRGKTTVVTVPPELRLRHTHLIGASGTGKSTLLLRTILQDLERGEGVAVLDPHGDLIDEVVARVPQERMRDVVLFDPADQEFPIGLNVLEGHSELERTLLASDLVAVIRRLATSWGDQMTSVLGNAILAFLESERGGTLVDLRRFLVESGFRRDFLQTVRDPEVVYYFEKEFTLLKGQPAAPILTRLDAFLRPRLIRRIVGQRDTKLDLAAILDGRKVFLAKLAQGLIGQENAALLGALLVAKFQQLALARQAQARTTRQPFYLYLDEFQHVATPSLTALLSGARKYALGLVLAHQEMHQLEEQDRGLASAVLTNPAVRIVFRVGEHDARTLAEGFASFEASDLMRLGVGEAICRLDRADWDFTLTTESVEGVDGADAERRREEIVRLSRQAYARPRADVEAELTPAGEVSVGKEAPRTTATDEIIAPTANRSEEQRALAEEKLAAPGSPREVPPEPTEAPRTAPKRRVERPHLPTSPGRGGPEHKYLQQFIKRIAEDRGFRVVVEHTVLDGTGRIDVALDRDGQKIACEIAVASTVENELANIQKCLAAGYEKVFTVTTDAKFLRGLEGAARTALSAASLAKVKIGAPANIVTLLDELTVESPTGGSTVRGYKVKVNYRPVSDAAARARKDAISRVLAQGLRRIKRDPPERPPEDRR